MNIKKADRQYKSDRLNYIINRIRVCHDITPARLASELDVSERTIYRDMRSLEADAGLQKRYSRREGRYLLDSEPLLPALTLLPSEALALYKAASNPALLGDSYMVPALQCALAKLATTIVPQSNTDQNIEFNEEHVFSPIIEAIRRAIREHHKIQILYRCDDSSQSLIVCPYDIRQKARHSYLIAKSEMHANVRLFKIARVQRVDILNESFRYPRRYSPELFFDRAWKQQGGRDDEEMVKLRFAPDIAPLICASLLHMVEGVCIADDGYLTCLIEKSLIQEMRWWILSFGTSVEVISPAAVRAEFASIYIENVERYRSSLV